jgi:type I restriction enzyme, S subunit
MKVVRSAKLQEVADINPPLPYKIEADEPVAFLPMAAVDAGLTVASALERRECKQVSKGYTPFINGDVLVAKITPCFENGKIAQAAISEQAGYGSTEFHVVRANSSVLDSRYLVHYLRQKSVRVDGERKMTGSAGQRRVPQYFLEGLDIPVPELAQQRRIAERLGKPPQMPSAPLSKASITEAFSKPAPL